MNVTHRSLAMSTALILALPAGVATAQTSSAASAITKTTGNAAGALLGRSATGDDPKNAPGAGPLKVRLTNLPDGRIKVNWKGKGPRKNFKPWKIMVSTSRAMNTDVKVYRAKGKKRSKIVYPAASVTPASGDYTFVKIKARRKHGLKGGGSPTKWIQAPVTAVPTGTDHLVIGTFNVRDADITVNTPGWATWDKRKPNVISTITSSGAGIINLQEASGMLHDGQLGQAQQIADGTGMSLVDANAYTGRQVGRSGARILYNPSKYAVRDHGAQLLPSGYRLEWAEFQEKASGRWFFDISMHLKNGTAAADEKERVDEANTVIALARTLASRDGGVPVYVAGDSNSTTYTKPKGLVHRTFIGAGMYDAFATRQISGQRYATTNGFSFPLKPSPIRRDVIMSFNAPAGSFWYRNLAYNNASQLASDHFMQVAELPLA